MVMLDNNSLENRLALECRESGIEIREAVNDMSLDDRNRTVPSTLKGANTKYADLVGEDIIVDRLRRFGARENVGIHLIVDPKQGEVHELHRAGNKERIFVYADPVDGTVKTVGVGNDGSNSIYRVVGDGAWGIGFAITDLTRKEPSSLTVGDFKNGVLVNGNPRESSCNPRSALTYKRKSGEIVAVEVMEKDSRAYSFRKGDVVRLTTSSQRTLGQGFLIADWFQGYDRKTASPGTEDVARELFSRLMNRNEGGAFDLHRFYGSAAEALCLFGYRIHGHPTLEPATLGKIAVNDDGGNVVPAYPLILAAGGCMTDFTGNDLGTIPLSKGRFDYIAAGNREIGTSILDKVKEVVGPRLVA